VFAVLGQTPLHFAAKNGHVELARYLIDKGPGFINFYNIRFRTPLHWACSYAGYKGYDGCEEIAYMLARAGGDLNFKNKDGCSPLWYAQKSPLGKSFAANLKEAAKGVVVRPVEIGMDRVYWG
jgi:ankyrin repeat protein